MYDVVKIGKELFPVEPLGKPEGIVAAMKTQEWIEFQKIIQPLHDEIRKKSVNNVQIICDETNNPPEVVASDKLNVTIKCHNPIDLSSLPWWKKDKNGWPIELYNNKPIKNFFRIICQNIRKVTG